jgi:hypothetical protein
VVIYMSSNDELVSGSHTSRDNARGQNVSYKLFMSARRFLHMHSPKY